MLPEGLFLREDGVVDVARTPNGVRMCAGCRCLLPSPADLTPCALRRWEASSPTTKIFCEKRIRKIFPKKNRDAASATSPPLRIIIYHSSFIILHYAFSSFFIKNHTPLPRKSPLCCSSCCSSGRSLGWDRTWSCRRPSDRRRKLRDRSSR